MVFCLGVPRFADLTTPVNAGIDILRCLLVRSELFCLISSVSISLAAFRLCFSIRLFLLFGFVSFRFTSSCCACVVSFVIPHMFSVSLIFSLFVFVLFRFVSFFITLLVFTMLQSVCCIANHVILFRSALLNFVLFGSSLLWFSFVLPRFLPCVLHFAPFHYIYVGQRREISRRHIQERSIFCIKQISKPPVSCPNCYHAIVLTDSAICCSVLHFVLFCSDFPRFVLVYRVSCSRPLVCSILLCFCAVSLCSVLFQFVLFGSVCLFRFICRVSYCLVSFCFVLQLGLP